MYDAGDKTYIRDMKLFSIINPGNTSLALTNKMVIIDVIRKKGDFCGKIEVKCPGLRPSGFKRGENR